MNVVLLSAAHDDVHITDDDDDTISVCIYLNQQVFFLTIDCLRYLKILREQ